MDVPLRLRNELFALLTAALQRAELEPAFDWLAAFAALGKERAHRGELGAFGEQEMGLRIPDLRVLLSSGFALRSSSAEAWIESGAVGYLADRAPRLALALRSIKFSGPKSPGIERDLHGAQVLFNAGLFFDCHEYLEPAWRSARDPERRMLQGLIQAGAGFHKFELGSPLGCATLLEVAAAKLGAAPDSRAARLAPFAAALLRCAVSARRGGLELREAPRLALVRD